MFWSTSKDDRLKTFETLAKYTIQYNKKEFRLLPYYVALKIR